ncbi:MAG: methionyl-tRNA formyltransferase [Verrucomicrobiota bacterium]|nr:methionyl-tRNA formyltransferase [Verrucomicrobiota bacterium]
MPDLPKIVYFGSDAICLPGLQYLHEQACDLCTLAAVVSQPDRRQGRGKKLQQNSVAEFASSKGIPLLQPEKPDAALADWLCAQKVALAFVMAYGHFLPKAVREAPRHGMLNFHASILPAYRGASPVEAAIAHGEVETGVSLMQVVKEMDAGAVADCERVSIENVDTSLTLRSKVAQAVISLLERNLRASLLGALALAPQNNNLATQCRKIRKEDGALDFAQPAALIDARLRAFTPWPGGYFDHGETRIKVGKCSLAEPTTTAQPGSVIVAGEILDVATSKGILRIHELQRPSGRLLPASEFLRGYMIEVGEVLPSVQSHSLLI